MLKYITLLLSLLFVSSTAAQNNDTIPAISNRLHIEANLGLGWGTGNFQRKYDSQSLSVNGAIGYKLLKDEFIYLQLSANWHRLQRYETKYTTLIDNFTYDVRHSASSAALDFQLALKYEAPQIYYIIPFARFSFGTRNAYFYTEIRDDQNDEVLYSERLSNDWSYLYTMNAGVQVPVTNSFHLHLSGTYSGTGSMNVYLSDEEGRSGGSRDPADFYSLHRSAVNLLYVQLGMTLYYHK